VTHEADICLFPASFRCELAPHLVTGGRSPRKPSELEGSLRLPTGGLG
jgi:hypothetical protein